MEPNKPFYDAVRPLFGGRLSQIQVDGLRKIINYADKWGYSKENTGYILGTIKHETADWMVPIREGASRHGPDYTDAQSKRAVKSIFDKGIISFNYAKPKGPFNQSYYGRGLVQITLMSNYKKFEDKLNEPLLSNPDLALEWSIALDIVFLGLRDGDFTGKKLGDYQFPDEYKQARVMVNSDGAKKWGGTDRIDERIARWSRQFLEALNASETGISPLGDDTPREGRPPAPEPPVSVSDAIPADERSDAPDGRGYSKDDSKEDRTDGSNEDEDKTGWEWIWPFS